MNKQPYFALLRCVVGMIFAGWVLPGHLGAAVNEDTYVTSVTSLGNLRNNYSGWVGMQILVGGSPVTVTQVGRMMASGNSGVHTVKLVKASDGQDVPGGSAAVSMSGGTPGQFRYGVLSSPVVLDAGTTYWVVSQETAGGDSWHDYINTKLTTTAVAADNGLAWGTGPGAWNTYTLTNQAFVPVDFKYTSSSQPVVTVVATDATASESAGGQGPGTFTFTRTGSTTAALTVNFAVTGTASPGSDYTAIGTTVDFAAGSSTATKVVSVIDDAVAENAENVVVTLTSGTGYAVGSPSSAIVTIQDDETPADVSYVTSAVSLGNLRNNFSGWVGMQVTVGGSPVTVTQLGRIMASGNTGVHTVKLVKASDGQDVPGGSALVSMGGGTPGQFRYGVLSNPVVLQAGTAYWVLSQETSGGDSWHDYINTNLTTTGVAVNNALAWGTGPGAWNTFPISNQSYVPVNFKYTTATQPVVTVAATDATAGEPGTGEGTGTFTFTRTGSTAGALTVNFTVSGTATSGSDYTTLGTTVDFAAGSATATKVVTVIDDAVVDAGETVIVTVGAGAGYTVGSPASATMTIEDDDAPPPVTVTVAATDATAGEPGTSEGTGTFTFTRTGSTAGALTVNFTVSGTATSGSDYTALGTTVDFAAGSATATKVVTVIDDAVTDAAETVIVTVGAGTGYTVGSPASATVTIQDDDAPPPVTVTVAATDATAGEPGTSEGTGTFTFTRTGSTAGALTVNFTVSGTATSGSDYAALGTTVDFAAGSATATKVVTVIDDAVIDAGETVIVTVGAGTGYTVGSPASATVTIEDDDAPPPVTVTVAATDATAGEPGTSEGTGTFTFTRTGSTAGALTVNFTVSGTATSGSDYTALGTTVDFAAGSATATKVVTVIDDAVIDAGETVIVTVGAGAGYTVGSPASATVTIQDDDTPSIAVTVTATDAAAGEAATGEGSGTFTFTRTGPTTASLTVNYTVSGTANSGTDYTAIGTSVTFAAGSATATKVVTVVEDTIIDPAETVVVTLAAGTGYSVGSPSAAQVTIHDDDTDLAFVTGFGNLGALRNNFAGWVGMQITVGASPITVTQLARIMAPGNSETHTVKLVKASDGLDVPGGAVTISMAGGTVGQFRYGPLASPVTLSAGNKYWILSQETTDGDSWHDYINTALATTTVAVDDALAWGTGPGAWNTYATSNQAFGPVNFKYAAATSPTVTVLATDDQAGEPSSGRGTGTFTFYRTGSTAGTLTVNYTVEGSATSGSDYNSIGGSVSFSAGSATATRVVTVVDDDLVEAGETVVVTLASGAGYTVGGPSTATVTIQDDEAPPSTVVTVAATDAVAGEPGSSGGTGLFTFSRTGPTAAALTVNFSVSGTASPGSDYTSIGTSVNFAVGSATATVLVSVLDDAHWDGGETVVVNLAAGEEYAVGTPSVATITLEDDESAPPVTVAATDATAGEPGTGQGEGSFTFTRTGSTALPMTVNFTITGTATNGTDYTTIANTIDFAAGSATAVLPVTVVDDAIIDAGETVIVTLAPGATYSIGNPSSATVTIQDDDSVAAVLVSIAATDATAGEPGTSQGTGMFTFTRTGSTAGSLTINYAIGGTATVGSDYAQLASTVTFAPGSATATAEVTVIDDLEVDPNETVIATVTAGAGYSVGSPASAAVTITDDESGPDSIYVTSVEFGALRNDFSGWVGMQIVVAQNPVTVTQLGRMMAFGNVGTHTVKLVRASDGLDVPGGSVAIPMSGGTPGQFRYGALSSPVTLAAGTTYWVLSQETAGGDSWFDYINTVITTTPVAVNNGLAWGTGPGAWNTFSVSNQSFVPVSFKYTESLPFITVAATDGTAGESATGQGSGTFTFSRTGSTASALTVNFTVGGSATSGSDYTAIGTTVTFAAGSATATKVVNVLNDTLLEGNETVVVNLATGAGYTFEDPASAAVTILDAGQTNSVVGSWSQIYPLPTLPIHANLLPDGRILMFQHGHDAEFDPATGKKNVKDNPKPVVWDPSTLTYIRVDVPDRINGQKTDSFYCAGMAMLPDGRVAISGGHKNAGETEYHGSPQMAIFDYSTSTWTLTPPMNDGRWYPTNVPLNNGKMLVIGGFILENEYNLIPQIYDPLNNTWHSLTAASWQLPLYPWMYRAPNGSLFYAGPEQQTRYLNVDGAGSWAPTTILATYGPLRVWPGALHRGTSVLYDEYKILNPGGGPTADGPSIAHAEVIDLKAATPTWREVAPMNFARQHHNATLLPDGKVLVTGGTTGGIFDYSGTVYAAEMWDPATETWSVMANMTQPRLHHAVALLMPDGRVLVGGGGQTEHPGEMEFRDVEFYSPPYLFRGPRPVINSAPASIAYGEQFLVQTADTNIDRVVLIRLPSVTHGFDQNQSYSKLSFTPVQGGLAVNGPTDTNLVPPGHYMLFILNTSGVPGVAKIVKVESPTQPSVTVFASDATAGEPGSGSGSGTFTFIRTGSTAAALTVNYSISGTATAGTDYTALGTTVNFAAGSATATKVVNVIDDVIIDNNETVTLTVSAGTGYLIGSPSSATVTIQDDDVGSAPTITVAATDDSAGEPGSGEGTGTFTFTRSGATTSGLTVNYTVTGTATSGSDYTSIGTSVSFAAGSATATKVVTVNNDSTAESDETVIVTLSAGANYAVGTPSSATVTIQDDDTKVITVAATDASAGEPGSGQGSGTFTFTRSGSTSGALTVNYTVTGTATSGSDYTSIGTTVNFASGSATATKVVTVTNDALVESNETVVVTLTSGTGYVVGTPSVATITIEDDDAPAVTVAASDASAGEPGSGNGSGTFTFTRTGSTTAALTVNFTVSGGATSGTDYTALGTTVSFAAGSATATKQVSVIDDAVAESGETVVLTLAAGSGYAVGNPSSATVTIEDDDSSGGSATVTISATDPTAGEPGNGQGAGTFALTRTGPTSSALTVNFTVSGTATQALDYAGIGTSVTFAAGSATATTMVSVIDDEVFDGNETVIVTLAAGSGYTVGGSSSATVIIQDDDPSDIGYVTSTSLGSLRNDFSGSAGLQIVVSGNPLNVTQLGRMMALGNIGSHTLKLVKASDGLDVPGGAVTISMTGGTVGEFRYGRLASPVTLAAGTVYWVVSQELAGGDSWHDRVNTDLTTTPVASGTAVVWGNGPGTWNTLSVANQAFGPVDIRYQRPSGPWSATTPMPIFRAELNATVLNNLIYAGGGFAGTNQNFVGTTNAFQSFDPVSATWTNLAPLPETLHHFGIAAVGGKIYVTGGFTGNDFSTPRSTVHVFDPATGNGGSWAGGAAPLPHARAAHASVEVGGLLFVIGGVTNDPLNFRAYNPATNTWDSNRAQMPTLREHIAAAVVNNKIYVIAGRWGNVNVATVEEYDPATNVWTTKASIPTARSGITCGVINGKIHVTGGEDQLNLNIYNQHEVYDPVTNTWATLPALPVALHGHASGVVNGLWYNIGGFRAVGVNTFESLTNGTEVYTP